MGSTRLPGKILKEVDGVPLLKYMVRRVEKSSLIDKILIATTINSEDQALVDFCAENNIECYAGSEDDVLDRYYQAAKALKAKHVVRLTSDCPLIDPFILDRTIQLYFEEKVDYAANTVPPDIKKYPDGSDVEVFSFPDLEKIWNRAKDPKDREHVTFYFWRSDQKYKTALLDNEHDWGKYRITIDYPEDFEVIQFIIRSLDNAGKFGTMEEIVDILIENPKIFETNAMYTYGMNW